MTVPIATISSDGNTLDPGWGLRSIEVHREIDRIPDARVVLLDGGVGPDSFGISDASAFVPGKMVTIQLRHTGETDETVFEGPVIRQEIEASADGMLLTVELRDAAIKLTQARRSVVHRDMSDGEVVSRLVEDAGLKTGKIASTEPQHSQLVQHRATDWDFMLSRADVSGLVVIVHDGTVSLLSMEVADDAPTHSVRYGETELFELRLMADGASQVAGVQSLAWDIQSQELTEPSEAEAIDASAGDLKADQLAEELGHGVLTLSHSAPVDADELKAWAHSRLARSRLALTRGKLVVPGKAVYKPFDVVELAAVGKRYDGKLLISEVHHRVDDNGWSTELQLGLKPDWFCHRDNVAEAPAAGLLPPIHGLHVGVVDEFEEDPDGEFRARVLLPGFDAEDGKLWARLASPDAGADRGFFFRPEAGDEVVVGFFNNDPRQPVVLGSMYSSANPPPEAVEEPTEDNLLKGLVTRGGSTILFGDDDKAVVRVETPGGRYVLLDDDAGAIEIADQDGNSVVMNADGVAITSAADLKLEADGDVTIKGKTLDVQ